ncbi:MAG: polysaccharide biosynthesis protein, partial [Anaerolineales bacterium]|nr:polysaccharide biosynthesis protein [Anaerolineales bacterium]
MRYLRNRHFFLLDLILLPAVSILAFALRLDPEQYLKHGAHIAVLIIIAVPVKLIIARIFGLYKRYWHFASTEELILIAIITGTSLLVTTGLLFGLALPLSGIRGFPRSIPIIDGMLTLLALGGPRFAVRMAWQSAQRDRYMPQSKTRPDEVKRVLIIGAGNAGAMIAREMQANPHLGMVPVGYIDDDRWKSGVLIHGIHVLGTREQIPELVKDYGISEVIIAMPRVSGSVVREILDICMQVGVPTRTIPGLYDIIAGQVSVSQIRSVDIEDLLRRDPVRIDAAAVHQMIQGRRVLVTGGGGSIGSELCRQILRFNPEQLVLMGHGENSVFTIHSELKRDKSIVDPHIVPIVADVKDKKRLDSIFTTFQPELVFHAAAHKHVSLMETNVCEAVINNVKGAKNLIEISGRRGVSRLVLVSTDKAVNPTSIMGVTKRVTELLVQNAASCHGQRCSAVRFGNVLG